MSCAMANCRKFPCRRRRCSPVRSAERRARAGKLLPSRSAESKPPSEEESVAAFVRRKFGHEILEYLVSPFVSGVYAGDPEKLSLQRRFPTLDEWEREYGSVLRGAMKSRPPKEQRKGRRRSVHFGTASRPFRARWQPDSERQCDYDVRAVSLDFVTPAPPVPACRNSHRAKRSANESTAAGAVVIATPAYAAAT